MPMKDGTGPRGMGPKTGRGFGPCGYGLGWRNNDSPRRGLGSYFGFYNQPQSKDEKRQALAEYKKALEEELEDINREEKDLDK